MQTGLSSQVKQSMTNGDLCSFCRGAFPAKFGSKSCMSVFAATAGVILLLPLKNEIYSKLEHSVQKNLFHMTGNVLDPTKTIMWVSIL